MSLDHVKGYLNVSFAVSVGTGRYAQQFFDRRILYRSGKIDCRIFESESKRCRLIVFAFERNTEISHFYLILPAVIARFIRAFCRLSARCFARRRPLEVLNSLGALESLPGR